MLTTDDGVRFLRTPDTHHRYRDAGHVLQQDQGEDIARRPVAFIAGNRP